MQKPEICKEEVKYCGEKHVTAQQPMVHLIWEAFVALFCSSKIWCSMILTQSAAEPWNFDMGLTIS